MAGMGERSSASRLHCGGQHQCPAHQMGGDGLHTGEKRQPNGLDSPHDRDDLGDKGERELSPRRIHATTARVFTMNSSLMPE